jgi:hypothetical protein
MSAKSLTGYIILYTSFDNYLTWICHSLYTRVLKKTKQPNRSGELHRTNPILNWTDNRPNFKLNWFAILRTEPYLPKQFWSLIKLLILFIVLVKWIYLLMNNASIIKIVNWLCDYAYCYIQIVLINELPIVSWFSGDWH